MDDYREYDDDSVHDMWVDFTDHEYTGELTDWYGSSDVTGENMGKTYDECDVFDEETRHTTDMEEVHPSISHPYIIFHGNEKPAQSTLTKEKVIKGKLYEEDAISKQIDKEKTINKLIISCCILAVIISFLLFHIIY